jgi:hypothetical protein
LIKIYPYCYTIYFQICQYARTPERDGVGRGFCYRNHPTHREAHPQLQRKTKKQKLAATIHGATLQQSLRDGLFKGRVP